MDEFYRVKCQRNIRMARSSVQFSPDKTIQKNLGRNTKILMMDNKNPKALRTKGAMKSIPNKISIGQKKIRRNYYEDLIEEETLRNRQQSMFVP